jgi:hypothetical protein
MLDRGTKYCIYRPCWISYHTKLPVFYQPNRGKYLFPKRSEQSKLIGIGYQVTRIVLQRKSLVIDICFMKRVKRTLLTITVLIVAQWATPALAEKAYLSDIVITNVEGNLLVYFTVKDCFTPEMNSAIENGIETTFTFFVKLYEKIELSIDKKITDLEIKHSIKYDNLKKIYEVRLSEQGNKPITFKDFEEAKKLMSEVVGLKVTPLSNLQEGRDYQIQMMAELDKITLPFYLHYVLFFLSLWDFETDWHTIDFRY